METIEQIEAKETVKIGPDVVTITGDKVVIDAKHEMPDWQVREYAPAPIYFRDKKYFLRRKVAGEKPFKVRYHMEPWREGVAQGKVTFTYDAETVAQREGELRGGRLDDAGRAGLIFFYPVLGLLWSEPKEKLRRFGFDPRGVTGISIFLVFGIALLDLVFAKAMIFKGLKSGDVGIGGILKAFSGADYLAIGSLQIQMLWVDVVVFILLILDVLVRYSHHLKDEEPYYGFLEWLFPRRKAPKKVKLETPPIAVIHQEKPAEEPMAPIRMSNR